MSGPSAPAAFPLAVPGTRAAPLRLGAALVAPAVRHAVGAYGGALPASGSDARVHGPVQVLLRGALPLVPGPRAHRSLRPPAAGGTDPAGTPGPRAA
ncbi:hypothetical protein [Peterkaempfera griseoplana]|uniref:hypothetical protein n=1 Tax=Peterkaempfera griseoplana TaxID=66896 RepID=UPI0006E20166|nr:hypothetical protein [Peterkaempfera griseoplana]